MPAFLGYNSPYVPQPKALAIAKGTGPPILTETLFEEVYR